MAKQLKGKGGINDTKQQVILLLAILIGLQFVLLWKTHSQVGHLNRTVNTLQGRLSAATAGAAMQRVAISPSERAVYIPELGIRLPLNSTTSQFVYSTRSADEADISTAALAAYPMEPQPIGCTVSVRIKLEDKPNPYNPHETVQASVKLANGKTLQAYSYQHDTCEAAFKNTGTDSVAQAAAFKEATSY